ncbi:fimbrillin family protein [Candidatus Symbiothrix dinenymphae]|uniref:fimbrillin family protein n=1 Tax=Candidatus Symbiothrix dinenymphae TaxID=467085 RepID=UPI0006C5E0C9|nr:fimbrillin family protein [Candidatus Symbiothrix dinenymphae]GAP73427.1 hypothetical protein SAMD00024442_9_28 [Candidatus Symbiothrix dinenymphae]
MRTISLSAMALSALLFAGCSSNNDNEVTPGVKNNDYVGDGVIEFSSGKLAEFGGLRLAEADGIVTWEATDEIAITMVKHATLDTFGVDVDRPYKAAAPGKTVAFTPLTAADKIVYPSGLGGGAFDFLAIYPRKDLTVSSGPSAITAGINLAVPAEQTDWMVAYADNSGNGYTKAGNAGAPVVLKFDHLLAKLVVTVTSGAGSGVPPFTPPNNLTVVVNGAAVNTAATISFASGAIPTLTTPSAPSVDITATKKGPTPAAADSAIFEVFLLPFDVPSNYLAPGSCVVEFRVEVSGVTTTYKADLSAKIAESNGLGTPGGLAASKKYTLKAVLKNSDASYSVEVSDFLIGNAWNDNAFE